MALVSTLRPVRKAENLKPHPCADRHEIWEPQPSGTLRACPGIALPSIFFYTIDSNYLHGCKQMP